MRAARAVADVSEGKIHAMVEIAVPPERVFKALASEDIVNWWGSDDQYRVTKWTGEVRVGGTWKSEGKGRDGNGFSVSGEFLVVDPPRRLVYTWKYDWDSSGSVTTITWKLEPIDGGTRIVVLHEGFGDAKDACLDHTDGWERVLSWLVGNFARGAR